MGDPRNTRKYPEISEIPESKKDTRKYPFVYFDTPTRPEPNPLPIFFPIPDPILKNPTRWALVLSLLWCRRIERSCLGCGSRRSVPVGSCCPSPWCTSPWPWCTSPSPWCASPPPWCTTWRERTQELLQWSGLQKFCEGTRGPRRKVRTQMKILSQNILLRIKICCDLRAL